MEPSSSILNYRGNPDLGGFNGQGAPLIGSNTDHYGEFANMFRDIVNKNYEFSAKQYDQAVADRNAATNLFAQQQINHPLEEKDRPEVEKAYNNVKDVMLKYNGNPMSHPQGRVEISQAIANFQQLKALGQSRNLEASKQRSAIANEIDSKLKQQMIDHLDGQMGKGIYHVPDPFPKQPSYELSETLYNPGYEVLGKPEYEKDAQGVAYLKQNEFVDPKKIQDYYRNAILDGNNKGLIDKIAKFYDDTTHNPSFDERKITAINDQLNAINKKQGWGIGNPYYTDPIKYTKNDDGTLNIQDNPNDLAMKQAMYTYGDMQRTTRTPSKEAQAAFQRIASEKKDIKEGNAAASNAQSNRIKANALVGKYREDARLAKVKGDQIEYKTSLLKSENYQPAKTVYDALNAVNNEDGYKPFSEILNSPNGQWTLANSNSSVYKQIIANKDNLEIKEIDNTDPILTKMVATQAVNDKGKPIAMSQKPVKIFAVRPKDGNVADMQIVGLNKDGSLTRMNMTEGAVNLIRVDNGFKSDNKVLDKENAVRSILSDLIKDDANDNKEPDNDIDDEENGNEETSVNVAAPSSAAPNVPAGVYNVNGKPYYYDGNGGYRPVK